MKKLVNFGFIVSITIFLAACQKVETFTKFEPWEEKIYSTNENIKLDTVVVDNIKYKEFLGGSFDRKTFKFFKNDQKKFYINKNLYKVEYVGNMTTPQFYLKNLTKDEDAVKFGKDFFAIVFDDTDINGKLYFGLKTYYNNAFTLDTIEQIYSYDGKKLTKLDINEIDELSFFVDRELKVSYKKKYIVYTKDYKKSHFVNILNNEITDVNGTVLALKHNKALVLSSNGNDIFNTRQYKLSVLNLDTKEETILYITNDNPINNKVELTFYESKSQFIVSLPNKQNIDIVSLKNVKGDLNKIDKLYAKIYPNEYIYADKKEMSLERLFYSIKHDFKFDEDIFYKEIKRKNPWEI
ncbi:hypothetical protein CRU86_08570 [Aliarcobacter skirrowii]|uniref:hypothetical protein n=1 Tax=Aliarcobacter skirrowii TaxID=28200 RepID=UPI00100BE9F7|nr:hypothetical protein [Aliarcobacter skirrowii]RXJ75332.1 hypothetical protein CRU86_08570 [Aliarcobacter skirrowii]